MVSASIDLFTFLLSFSTGVVATFLWARTGNCYFRPMGSLRAKGRQVGAYLTCQGEPLKMTLVVRKDLKMGTGKAAAQCAHAAVAVIEEIHNLRLDNVTREADDVATRRDKGSEEDQSASKWITWCDAWTLTGSKKVALQCNSEEQLMEVLRAAKKERLPHALVRDAGRTQIAPGSKTVLAVGPAPLTQVDRVTGHLKLL